MGRGQNPAALCHSRSPMAGWAALGSPPSGFLGFVSGRLLVPLSEDETANRLDERRKNYGIHSPKRPGMAVVVAVSWKRRGHNHIMSRQSTERSRGRIPAKIGQMALIWYVVLTRRREPRKKAGHR